MFCHDSKRGVIAGKLAEVNDLAWTQKNNIHNRKHFYLLKIFKGLNTL